MPCIVEQKTTNEIYPNCVLDNGEPEDCDMADGLKSRNECRFWVEEKKVITQAQADEMQSALLIIHTWASLGTLDRMHVLRLVEKTLKTTDAK